MKRYLLILRLWIGKLTASMELTTSSSKPKNCLS